MVEQALPDAALHQSVSQIMHGIEDLVPGRIAQRGENLKAHPGKRCTDDEYVLVWVFERTV
jgi:hypothetical protein